MALAMVWKYSPDPWLAEPPDPDSLLRLVQVRDLMAGQAWSDPVQYRLGGDGGLAMHWSRLVDAPIAAVVATGGEPLAMFAWPLALYLVFIVLALALARRLGGSAAILPAAAVAALNVDIITHFIPGRLDHHNVQLVLLLVLVAGLVGDGRGRSGGVVAGLALAAMLAVGMEALPFALTTGAVLTLTWAFGGRDSDAGDNAGADAGARDSEARMAAFGVTFAVALAVLYTVAVPAGGAGYCDAYSAAYLAAGILGGLGITGLALVAARAGATVRLTGLAAVGAVIIAVTALFFPACLAGPMGNVSAELKAEWLDTVAEAQPLWSFAAVFPEEAFATFAAPVLATIVACRRAAGTAASRNRRPWVCMAVFLLAALLLSIYQYRGSPFLNALSIPVLAVWIAEWRRRVEERITGQGRALAVLMVWLAGLQVFDLALGEALAAIAAGAPPASVSGNRVERPEIGLADPGATAAERECIDPKSADALASLPRGRVLAPLFYGSTLLAISEHSALAGPYHRAAVPILDTMRATGGTVPDARAVVDRHAIDYIVVCPTSREALLVYQEQPSGFIAGLMLGRRVPWLEPVAVEKTYLHVYRVR